MLATILALSALQTTKFVLVDTPKYSFEVPEGWEVGRETPWGARDIVPKSDAGKLGAMTAGPTTASWEELYRTSLYFIMREGEGKATPFRVGKTKGGYESIAFEVANNTGFADRRYVLLKNSQGSALALSVKLPSKNVEEKFVLMFQRMVDTAKIK
ncbi:MAG TPA: hypothetical protein PKA27_09225 [Fimbriimonadaceae bacterium]|nr:hypothetical protein [Fimbriimonadaceae bacterium]